MVRKDKISAEAAIEDTAEEPIAEEPVDPVGPVESEAVEITTLRGPDSKVFDIGNGQKQIVIQRGQHYWDRDTEKFEEYRPTIETDSRVEGFNKRFKGQHWTRFGNGGEWKIGFGAGRSLIYKPVGARREAIDFLTTSRAIRKSQEVRGAEASEESEIPSDIADTVEYADLWPDVDMSFTVFPEGVKESIVLKGPGAESAFAFDLELQGIELRANGASVDVLADEAVVGRIEAPTLVDAEGAAGTVIFLLDDNASTLTLNVDEEWLSNPERAYPVTIDPTTVVIQPDSATSQDTYVSENDFESNYGTNNNLVCGWNANNSKAYWIFAKFNLSGVPAGASVSSATFSLYAYTYGGSGYKGMDLGLVAGAWDAAAVTWNTRPGIGASFSGYMPTEGGWDSHGVAPLVRAWLAGEIANEGFYIKGQVASTYNWQAFSSEYSTASQRPKIEITYAAPPAVSVTLPNGTEASPTSIVDSVMPPSLVGQYTSPVPTAMAYRQHKIVDASGNIIWDSGKVEESAASGSTITVSASGVRLLYGRPYQWLWRAWDTAGGVSQWVGGWFICTLSAPTGLAANPDATHAKIDLSWATHPGQALAGHIVERSLHDANLWERANPLLVTTTAYSDDNVACSQAYDYRIKVRAEDGYTGPASTAVTNKSVAWSQMVWWLGTLALDDVVTGLGIDWPYNASVRDTLGSKYPSVQTTSPNAGESGCELTLGIETETRAMFDAIMAELRKGVVSLRGPAHSGEVGQAYRVHVSGRVRTQQLAGRSKDKRTMVIPLREVG